VRLGVLGGTFNPVHYGHLRAAEYARERLGLSGILFIPSGSPPLKSTGLAAPLHRFRMVEIATASNRFFEVSDIELRMKGKSYTVKTLGMLGDVKPGFETVFILGIDSFLDIPNWREPERLIGLSDFAVISRPGFSFGGLSSSPYIGIKKIELEALDGGSADMIEHKLKSGRRAMILKIPALDISATDIRHLISKGGSVKYLLPEGVESYIISNKLYT
jgi:nicotinate-nucleotide adenylyltransferase